MTLEMTFSSEYHRRSLVKYAELIMHPKLAINSVRLGEPLDDLPFTMVNIGLSRDKLVA